MKFVAIGLTLLLVAACGEAPKAVSTTPRDRFGDPLPEGAIARLGTLRFRDPAPPAPPTCLDADFLDEDRELATSPDGRSRATIDDDDRLVLEARGKIIPLAPRRGAGGAECLAYSPDGRTLAVGRDGGSILLVDASRGQVRRTLVGHTDSVEALRFDETGATLVSAADDRTVRIWDVATGEERGSIRQVEDDTFGLAVAGGEVRVWSDFGHRTHRLTDGALVDPDVGHRAPVRRLAVSRYGDRVASTTGSSTYVLWDARSGRVTARDESHVGNVTGLAFDGDDSLVASTGDEGGVRFRRLDGNTTFRARARGYMQAHRIVFNKGYAVTGGIWGSLRFWNPVDGSPAGTITAHDHRGGAWRDSRITALAIRGVRIASAAADKTIELHDSRFGHLLARYENGDVVQSLSFSSDGSRLACADGGELVLLDGSTLTEVARIGGAIEAAAFSPWRPHLATGDASGALRIHDAATGTVRVVVEGHTKAIRDLAFSVDGKILVTGSDDGTLLVWNVARLLGTVLETIVRTGPWLEDWRDPLDDPPRADGPTVEIAKGVTSRPYPGDLPGIEPSGAISVLVLDGTTGRPLVGARVRQFSEPGCGQPDRLLIEAVTDRHGVATLRDCDTTSDEQWVVDAPGFVAASILDERPPTVAVLFPGETLNGRLLEPLGAPAKGVEVGLFLGCGHSPTVARATTNDNGDFTLENINPEAGGHLWYAAPGLLSDYVDAWPLWSRGDARAGYVARPGRSATGAVVDERGTPAPGVWLKARNSSRGPWARSDDHGRYEIHGVDLSGSLNVYDADPDGSLLGEIEIGAWFPTEVPRRIVRPDIGRSADDFEYRHEVDFSIRVVDAETREPIPEITVTFLEHATGRPLEFEIDVTEWTTSECLSLREGEYTVAVGGPFATHASVPVTVRVRRDLWPPLVLEARRQPVLKYAIGGLTSNHSLRLVTANAERTLDPKRDDPIHLPADAACVIHVERERGRGPARILPVGPVVDGARHARGAAPHPHRILLRGLPADADVEFESDRLAWSGDDFFEQSDPHAILTEVAGRLRLRLRDEDRGIADLELHLPSIPGAVVEAPTIEWRGDRQAEPRLLLADGSPAIGARVRAWSNRESTSGLDGSTAVDTFSVPDGVPDGRSPFETWLLEARGPDLVPVLVAHRPGRVPEIRWGTAEVKLTVNSDGGDPLDFVVLVDGALVSASGEITLGGMTHGEHAMIVGVKEHRPRCVALKLDRDARREITIAFPAH